MTCLTPHLQGTGIAAILKSLKTDLSHVSQRHTSQKGLAHPHGHALWMICPMFMEKQIFSPKTNTIQKK